MPYPIRCSIYVPDDLQDVVRTEAARQDVSMARLIRDCIVFKLKPAGYRETDRRRRSETRAS